MKVTYVYNSGFVVEIENCMLIFDCFRAPDGDFPQNGVIEEDDILRDNVYVFVSHTHPDHYNPAILKWKKVNPNIKYILCRDLKQTVDKSTQTKFMDEGRAYSDNNINVKAFGSTDEGICFLVRVGNTTLFHAGDLNLWHWKEESSPEEIEAAGEDFVRELDRLEEGMFSSIDAAFFPIDPRLGRDYYEGALAFAKRFTPRKLFPMHFSGDFAKANHAQADIESCGVTFLALSHYGQQFELDD